MFGHVKGDWPHLEKITDPGVLEAELDRVRAEYNTVRCTPGSATSPPTMSTTDAATASTRPAVTGSATPAKPASPTVEPQPRTNNDHHPILVGYFIARLLH